MLKWIDSQRALQVLIDWLHEEDNENTNRNANNYIITNGKCQLIFSAKYNPMGIPNTWLDANAI